MSSTSRKAPKLTSQERMMVKRIIHASILEQERGAYQFPIHDAVNRAAFYTGLTPQVLLRIKANMQNYTDESKTQEEIIRNNKEPNKQKIIRNKKEPNKQVKIAKIFKLCHRIILMDILDKIFTKEILGRNPTFSEMSMAMKKVIPRNKIKYDNILYMHANRFINQRYHVKTENETPTAREEYFENENVSLKRYTYLKEIREYRKQNRNIIYLDETWVDDKLNCTKSWENLYDIPKMEELINEEILITLNAASKYGLLSEASKMKTALKLEADTLQLKHFLSWISLQLFPCLPRLSVIVVDNELFYECSLWKTSNITVNEEVIRDTKNVLETGGHEFLRLPAYMSKLNPFQLMWDKLKADVKSLKSESDVGNVIAEKISKITPEDWNAFDEEVRKQEELLWTKDKRLLDNREQLERLYMEEKNKVIVID